MKRSADSFYKNLYTQHDEAEDKIESYDHEETHFDKDDRSTKLISNTVTFK